MIKKTDFHKFFYSNEINMVVVGIKNYIINVKPEIVNDVIGKASKIAVGLTERALVNQLDSYFREKFVFPDKFLRSGLILTVRQFNMSLDIPLNRVGAADPEIRFEKITDFKQLVKEFFYKTVTEYQTEIQEEIDDYFSKYLE